MGETCCHQGHDAELAHHHRGDAICVDHVSFRYPGQTAWALEEVTLHVPRRTRLGIVGPNGGGKSTLLKLILGLLEPTRGTVQVLGADPHDACRNSAIGYVPQRFEVEMRFPLSVRQVVRLGLVGRAGLFHRYSKEQLAAAERAIEQVGMADLAERPIGDLSGGQQQRVFIARALAAEPKILVLDEPMVGVDEVGQRRFAALMSSLHAAYDLTLVIVSHDLRAIVAGCDRVACLNRRLHFHDAPSGLTQEVLNEVFAHSFSALEV